MTSIFDDESQVNQHRIFEVPAGMTIIKEGEVNLDMYKIVSGHVEMYTGYGTDREVLIGILGPGSCFGEFGLLTGDKAIYTIITYSDTKLLRVVEDVMGDFIKEYPEDIIKIMKNMAENMLRMQHQISQISEELVEESHGTVTVSDWTKENIRHYTLNTKDEKKGNLKGGLYFMNRDKK